MLSLGGAVTCFFFTAPHRLSLLTVGPVAAAPALWLLNTRPHNANLADIAEGATALAFALAFLANHMLRNHFVMATEREFLTEPAQARPRRALAKKQVRPARHPCRTKCAAVCRAGCTCWPQRRRRHGTRPRANS